MAKQVEEIADERVESLKTVKFGGYDKASVDYYIDELKEKHNKEVEDLKENVSKLSEAVLSLKTMREVNMTESSKTIETLKKANSDLESELEALKEQVNAYKQRELENAGRYESISRTLLEARESADALIAQTEKECTDKKNTITSELEAYETEVRDRCTKLQTVDLEKRVDGNKITTFYDVDGNVIYEKTTSFDGKKEKVVYYNNAGKPEKGYSLYLSNGLYGMKAFNYTPDGKENVDWITK